MSLSKYSVKLYTEMFTASFFSSSFETPDMFDCVFRLSWIAIIVVVKARAGVVVSPQAMEHGRHILCLVAFHHCEKTPKAHMPCG